MRKITLFLFVVCLLAACNNEPSKEEMAMKAAKEYYDLLLQGNYASFLAGKQASDSLPEDYREQLVTAYKQHLFQMREEHKGLLEVRAMRGITDTLRKETDAFLVLCFGDSTREEIVVPMVENDGKWMMK